MSKGQDSSRGVALWEAYFKGARYRMAVRLDGENEILLTLTGARHLRKKLDAAIKRLEKTRAPR